MLDVPAGGFCLPRRRARGRLLPDPRRPDRARAARSPDRAPSRWRPCGPATSSGFPGCSARRAWTLDARAIEPTELFALDGRLRHANRCRRIRRSAWPSPCSSIISSTCAWNASACSASTSIGPGHEPRRRRGRAGWSPCRSASAPSQNEIADVVTPAAGRLGAAAAAFAPGQFNMLYAFGVGEAAISVERRSRPRRRHRAHHPRASAPSRAPLCAPRARAGGGGARPLRTAMARRGAPRGADRPADRRGLGLAPLRPAIYHAASPPRPLPAGRACWSARARPADLLFGASSRRWKADRLRIGGARHRRPRGARLEGAGRRRARADRRGGPGSRVDVRVHLRARGDDALLGARSWRARASPTRASSCRWSGT